MMEYEVTITETLQKTVTVEADSKEDAEQTVKDMYADSDIVLLPDDFYDVDYKVGEGKEIDKTNAIEVLLVKPGQK